MCADLEVTTIVYRSAIYNSAVKLRLVQYSYPFDTHISVFYGDVADQYHIGGLAYGCSDVFSSESYSMAIDRGSTDNYVYLDGLSYTVKYTASIQVLVVEGNLYGYDDSIGEFKCEVLSVVASLVYRVGYRCVFTSQTTYITVDMDEAAFIISKPRVDSIDYPGYPGLTGYRIDSPRIYDYCAETSNSVSSSPSASGSPSPSSSYSASSSSSPSNTASASVTHTASTTSSPSLSISLTGSVTPSLVQSIAPYPSCASRYVSTETSEWPKLVSVIMASIVGGFMIGVASISYASR